MAADAPSAAWHRGKVTGWLSTNDHKGIGRLYLLTGLGFMVLAGIVALVMRAQLTSSNADVMSGRVFSQLATMHATTMVFFVALPLVLGLASFLVPLQVGASSIAAPRIHALSYWLLLAGGVVLWASWFGKHGAAKAGWTADAGRAESAAGHGQDLWLVAVLLGTAGVVLCCGCLLATLGGRRAEGMTWSRVPAFAWSIAVSATILVVSGLVFVVGAALMLADRRTGLHVFDASNGGSAVAWSHLFWFYAQPAIVAMFLPVLGVLAEVVPVFARTALAGAPAVRLSFVAIGALGLVTWGQHLFTADMPTWADAVFSVTSLALVVPVFVVLVQLIATVWAGRPSATPAALFALGSILFLALGAFAWVFLAAGPTAYQTAGSMFASGWLHTLIAGGAMLGLVAGLFYWWPKLFGRLLGPKLGLAALAALVPGIGLAFLPMLLAGLEGMPLGAPAFTQGHGALSWENGASTAGAGLVGLGVVLLATNILRTQLSGRRAGNDPWLADTLEWYASSPPALQNFDRLPAIESARPLHDLRARLGR